MYKKQYFESSVKVVSQTNKYRDLADLVESLFLVLGKMCSVCVANENLMTS